MRDIQSTNFQSIKSVSNNTWCYKPVNSELKNLGEKDLDIEKLTASILANRGIEGPDLAIFLDHTLKNNMPDPALINDMENPAKQTFVKIFDELSITANWLSGFKTDSILILNYGDLLANLPPASLDKEDSVSILSDIKILIREKSFSDSEKLLNFLIERWLKIEFSNKKSESLSAN